MESFESIRKFRISGSEIKRREEAFASLLVSTVIGLFIFELLFNLQELFSGTIIVGILLLISWIFIHIFFKSVKDNIVCIDDKYLQRYEHDTWIKYPLGDVIRVNIKHTTRNTIREIGFFFKNRKAVFINGIDEFDQFVKDILEPINKEVCQVPNKL